MKATSLQGGLVRRVALSGLLAMAGSTRADVIEINNSLPHPMNLSDLIVWDASGKQEVILKPGTDAAGSADDVRLGHQESRIYITDLKVAKYFVSAKSGTLGEYEWKYGHKVDVTTFTAMLTDTATGSPLHVDVTDIGAAARTIEPGRLATFTDGLSPDLPGWFVGTQADLVRGEILGGFTGTAIFEPGQLSVRVIPAPGALGALVALGLAVHLRRRRRGVA